MAQFFDLLPTDVQVHVCHTWLGDAETVMRTLSYLDVACCQTTVRPALLSLMTCLMPIGSESDPVPVRDMSGFLRWLHDRLPPVTAIRMKEGCFTTGAVLEDHMSFPMVRDLTIDRLPEDERSFDQVMKAFPNVQALTILQPDDDETGNSPYPAYLWTVLTSLPLRLSALTVSHTGYGWNVNPGFVGLLANIGSGLRRLSINAVNIHGTATVVVKYCPGLEILSIKAMKVAEGEYHFPLSGLLSLVEGCKQLKELELIGHFPPCNEEDLQDVLTAGRGQLRKFEICYNHKNEHNCSFPGLLEKHQWLEHLKVNRNEFNQLTGLLVLYGCRGYSVNSMLARVIPICRHRVHKLSVLGSPLTEDIGELLGDAFCAQLQELVINCATAVGLGSLLLHCPGLRKLHFSSTGIPNGTSIARCCPLLEQLTVCVRAWDLMDISDLQPIIASCKQLKELTCSVGVATHTATDIFQAILDNNLHLTKLRYQLFFKYAKDPFTSTVVEKFQARARKLQLLPVPVFEGLKYGKSLFKVAL